MKKYCNDYFCDNKATVVVKDTLGRPRQVCEKHARKEEGMRDEAKKLSEYYAVYSDERGRMAYLIAMQLEEIDRLTTTQSIAVYRQEIKELSSMVESVVKECGKQKTENAELKERLKVIQEARDEIDNYFNYKGVWLCEGIACQTLWIAIKKACEVKE